MSTFYQVLDCSTGNVIKDYPSEEVALAELKKIVNTYGIEEIKDLVLMRFADGRPSLVAAAEELIARLANDDAKRGQINHEMYTLKR